MRKKLLFFVNPNAGNGEIRSNLLDILQTFAAAGYEITVHPTQGPRDLTEVIRRDGEAYDMVVSVGGDGTLNETSAGVVQLPAERRPLIGYIPGGTVNDVASTLGLSKNYLRAAKEIVEGVPYPMDVGSFAGDRWFNYVAAFGAFTDVSYRTSQQDKRVLGRLAYLLDGVKSLSEIRSTEVEITCCGETRQETVLAGLVTSTTSVGGFKMRSDIGISLNDGLFEVLLIRHISSLRQLNETVSALLRGDFSSDAFYFCKTDRVSFRFPEPTDWTLDGEFGGTVTETEILNHPRAIHLMVPREK